MIRKALLSDLDEIMDIITDAKALLKESGSTQWNEPDGYPNRDSFISDINNQVSYVSIYDNKVVGVCAIIEGIDPSYIKIDGAWLSNGPYLAIHRIAVKKEYYHKGVSVELMNAAYEIAKNKNLSSIKGDTHPLNKNMQSLFIKTGFSFCGNIELVNNKYFNKRLAYERLVKQN